MVAINSPTEGALFSSSVSIPLVATVNTSWANITKVDFYDDTNTLIGTGQPSLEGAWLFPDGENFQLLTVTSGQGMMDYYDNLHQHMYNFVGSLESPLSLFGTLTDTWSEMTAPGGMTFSVGPNNTLDAQLYGMVLYGQSVTLTGGTNFAASQQFTFSWAHAGSGPHVLTARAHYGTGRIVTSAPLNITVEAAPEIVINGGFETGALAPWPNSGLVPPVITAAAAHSGQYGLELTSTFPPAFALQDIQTRLTADTLYSFTAWINIMQVVDVGQMAYYVPHLHINAGPSSVVAYATNALGLGWQKLEVSRSFTAAELQDTVTLGVGGCGQLRIDDISAAAAAATGYAAWALANFSQPEQAQGLADPAADPDGRGVPNLLRYGLGLMPRTPQLAMLPRLVQSSGTPGELAFEFDIPAPPPADVAYFLGVSSDLQRWDETALAGLTPEFDQTTGGRRLIRVVAPDPAPGQSRVFMTLIVR
jgi:hypothetical protein